MQVVGRTEKIKISPKATLKLENGHNIDLPWNLEKFHPIWQNNSCISTLHAYHIRNIFYCILFMGINDRRTCIFSFHHFLISCLHVLQDQHVTEIQCWRDHTGNCRVLDWSRILVLFLQQGICWNHMVHCCYHSVWTLPEKWYLEGCGIHLPTCHIIHKNRLIDVFHLYSFRTELRKHNPCCVIWHRNSNDVRGH